MGRLLSYAAVCLALAALAGCSAIDDVRSQRLYEEAVNAFNKGEETCKFSYSDAVPFYEKALVQLNEIKNRYPSSPSAVKIAKDEIVLGYYTCERFEKLYLPDRRKRARAEEDIFDCSLYMAEKNGGRQQEIAMKYVGIDNFKAGTALEAALEEVKSVRDQFQRDSSLESIINVYIEIKEYDRAARTAELMSEDGWGEAALMFAEAGRFDRCGYFINKIKDRQKRRFAWMRYGDRAAEKGNPEAAAGAADMVIGLLDSAGDESMKDSALQSAAVLYAKAGKFDSSYEIAEKINDPAVKGLALNEICLNCVKQGRISEGIGLLDKTYETLRSAGYKARSAMVPEEIASTYVKAGEYNKALEVLDDNFRDTEHIGLYEYMAWNFSLLSEVIIKTGAEGREELSDRAMLKLLELTASVKSENSGDWKLLNYAVIPLAKGGGTEKAEKAAELIRDNRIKADAYAEIAGRYIEEGRKEIAVKAVKKASEYVSAGGCEDPGQLIRIAGMYNDLGCRDEAANALDTAVKQAAGLEPGDARDRLLEASALLYCKTGLQERGMAAAELSGGEDWEKDSVLENISGYCAGEGQMQEAAEAAKQMRLPCYRGKAYAHMAGEYIKRQKTAEALGMLEKAFDEVSLSVDAAGEYFNEIPALFDIAEKYCAIQQKDRAAAAMAKALEAVKRIRDGNSKALFLADIGAEYIKLGIPTGEREKEILHTLVKGT